MNCLEAQSKIIAYIDYKLDKQDKQSFVKHIRSCKECREELEIYYTMLEGMRKLDDNIPFDQDLSDELDYRISHDFESTRSRSRVFRFSMFVVGLVFLFIGIVAYSNFIHFLENDEQEKLKLAQGQYYYSETFDDYLFVPKDDTIVRNFNITTEDSEETFYYKIRNYNYSKE